MSADQQRLARLLRVASLSVAAVGTLMVLAGLGLSLVQVLDRPADSAHMPPLLKVALTLLALGVAGLINGLTGFVFSRARGLAGVITVAVLLVLPLTVPMSLAAIGGVVAIWLAP